MIELSIVMIIIGLIIAAGLSIYDPSVKQALKEKNEVIVRDAVKSVIGYAAGQKALPTALTNVARSTLDAQQSTLQYAYDTNLNGSSTEKTICNRNDAGLTVVKKDNATDNNTKYTVTNVAAVVWSKGYDGASDVTISGSTYTFYEYSGTDDDLLGWATLSELKAAAGCVGSSLKILADGIPAGKEGSTYGTDTVTFKPDGGIADYSWCVEFPASIGTGKLLGKIDFNAVVGATRTQVTPVAFGSCTIYTVGQTFTMGGSTAFTSSSDQGTYDFIVYVKDSNTTPQSVSRSFTLTITQ
ncbi:MAG: hypothetical protein HQM02_01910 [Magnetococcales bacterium]|nr:hypothetical protein [Magnetococcales bacterium]